MKQEVDSLPVTLVSEEEEPEATQRTSEYHHRLHSHHEDSSSNQDNEDDIDDDGRPIGHQDEEQDIDDKPIDLRKKPNDNRNKMAASPLPERHSNNDDSSGGGDGLNGSTSADALLDIWQRTLLTAGIHPYLSPLLLLGGAAATAAAANQVTTSVSKTSNPHASSFPFDLSNADALQQAPIVCDPFGGRHLVMRSQDGNVVALPLSGAPPFYENAKDIMGAMDTGYNHGKDSFQQVRNTTVSSRNVVNSKMLVDQQQYHQRHQANEQYRQRHQSIEQNHQRHQSIEQYHQKHQSNEPNHQRHQSNEPNHQRHQSNEQYHQRHQSNQQQIDDKEPHYVYAHKKQTAALASRGKSELVSRLESAPVVSRLEYEKEEYEAYARSRISDGERGLVVDLHRHQNHIHQNHQHYHHRNNNNNNSKDDYGITDRRSEYNNSPMDDDEEDDIEDDIRANGSEPEDLSLLGSSEEEPLSLRHRSNGLEIKIRGNRRWLAKPDMTETKRLLFRSRSCSELADYKGNNGHGNGHRNNGGRTDCRSPNEEEIDGEEVEDSMSEGRHSSRRISPVSASCPSLSSSNSNPNYSSNHSSNRSWHTPVNNRKQRKRKLENEPEADDEDTENEELMERCRETDDEDEELDHSRHLQDGQQRPEIVNAPITRLLNPKNAKPKMPRLIRMDNNTTNASAIKTTNNANRPINTPNNATRPTNNASRPNNNPILETKLNNNKHSLKSAYYDQYEEYHLKQRAQLSHHQQEMRQQEILQHQLLQEQQQQINQQQHCMTAEQEETFLERLRHSAPLGIPWNVYSYYTQMMQNLTTDNHQPQLLSNNSSGRNVIMARGLERDHNTMSPIITSHQRPQRTTSFGSSVSPSPATTPVPVSPPMVTSTTVPITSNTSPSGGGGGNQDARKTSRVLTGKHVRQGTGASPATLMTLRQKIQERQKAREVVSSMSFQTGFEGREATSIKQARELKKNSRNHVHVSALGLALNKGR